MYVYISQEVLNTGDEQLQNSISRLKQLIEEDASLFPLIFDSLHPYWRSKLRRTWRLLGTVKIISDEEILCLTHLLRRSSHDYREFLSHREKWGEKHMQISQNKLTKWLTEQRLKEELENAPRSKIIVPEHLKRTWLGRPILQQTNHQRFDIFESRLWVDKWIERDENIIPSRWLSFHQIIVHVSETQNNDFQVNPTLFANVNQCTDPITECTILYSIVNPSDASDRRILLLLDLFPVIPSSRDVWEVGNSLQIFGSGASRNIFENELTIDRLNRIARRAYPDYLLGDENVWHDLEIDTDVNLALSGEEEDLLRDIRLPVFINGRAGSGKSTMLHYTFAYYCNLYLNNRNNTNESTQILPLFLTYNEKLVDRAYKVVKSVLISHAHYIERHHQIQDIESLRGCFRSFQKFLLDKLPLENSIQFSKNNYLSFNKFKEKFDRSHSNSKERYSAEIVWHAIRTYIKGFGFSEENVEFLKPDDYQDEVADSHKSFNNQDFKQIYDKFWDWYQKIQREENLWDDQDLVRVVLQNIINGKIQLSSYSAIFCDEAQDFTRIELQLILRLSAWSQYRLYPPIESLPFAFAGDPMQTVNPTGFRWDSLRASFYEHILEPLDLDGKLDFRNRENTLLKELQQNYRSTREIVYFSNIVHLWRKVLLDLADLKPQNSWWDDKPNSGVSKGIIGQTLTIQELRKLGDQGIIFVLPCDEGGEMKFVRDHKELLEIFPSVNEQKLPPNIYSAVAIKGSEFPIVMALFFGEYFAEIFQGHTLERVPSNSNNIELEYFLNKLYVAISRGKEYLAVIDTPRGEQCLWQSANQSKLESWLNRLRSEPERQDWDGKTNFLDDIPPNKNQNGNPLDLAKIFLLDGLNHHNPRFFSSAAIYFKRAEKPLDENYCEIWLVRLDGKLHEAGQRFVQLQEHLQLENKSLIERSLDLIQDAWECFWEGQHWQEIVNWCDRNPERAETQWRFMAVFMVATDEYAVNQSLFNAIYQFTDSLFPISDRWQADSSKLREVNWLLVLNRYHQIINQLLDNPNDLIIESNYLQIWGRIASNLVKIGFNIDQNLFFAARCAYQAKNYQEAIRLWEQCQNDSTYRDREDYSSAKAETTPVPEKFPWLIRAGKSEQIVLIWNSGEYRVVNSWQPYISIIKQALEQYEQHKGLLELEIQVSRWIHAIRYFNSRVSFQDPNFDDSLRIRLLTEMSNDKRLNSESIEDEAKSLFNQRISILNNVNARDDREAVRQARRLLTQFITDTSKTNLWTANLDNMETISQAFARVGEFVPELQFYEQFKDYSDVDICEYAKSQWIAVKRKQSNFARQEGQIAKAEEQSREADNAEQKWQCTNLPPNLLEIISESLTTLTEDELKSVKHYIQFLKFERSL